MVDQQHLQQQEMNAARVGGGLSLPPGFRFHLSDDEIVSIYLRNKVCSRDFTCIAIAEVDLNKTHGTSRVRNKQPRSVHTYTPWSCLIRAVDACCYASDRDVV